MITLQKRTRCGEAKNLVASRDINNRLDNDELLANNANGDPWMAKGLLHRPMAVYKCTQSKVYPNGFLLN